MWAGLSAISKCAVVVVYRPQATEEVIKQKLLELIGPKNPFATQLAQIFNRKVGLLGKHTVRARRQRSAPDVRMRLSRHAPQLKTGMTAGVSETRLRTKQGCVATVCVLGRF